MLLAQFLVMPVRARPHSLWISALAGLPAQASEKAPGARSKRAQRPAQPVVEITHPGLLLGAKRAAAEGAGLQIALGDLADAEILAHDLTIRLDGPRPGLGLLRARVAEIEMIDQPAFLPVHGQDARGIHAVGVNREGHIGIGPKPDPAIDRTLALG